MKHTKKQLDNKLLWIVPIVLFICGIILRFYRLKAFATFLGDQGRDAMIIKRIVTFEHLPAIGAPSSIGGVFLGPFYYYLVAPFLWLFRFDPVGLVVGVAFISCVGMIVSFFIVKRQVNLFAAVIFTTLLAFSSVNIDFSRFSWNPNLLPVFAFITLYLFYKTLQTNKIYYALSTGAFFSLSFQLHHLAALMIVPMAVFWMLEQRKSILKKENIQNLLLFIISFGVVSSPLLAFDLKHQFLNTKSLIGLFTNNGVSSSGEILTAKTPFIMRFIETTSSFFNYILKFQLSGALSVIVFLLLLGLFAWKYSTIKNTFVRLMSLNFFLFIIFFSFLNSQRHPHYYGVAYYSFFLFVAYMLSTISLKKIMVYPLIGLLLLGYIGLNARNYYFFYNIPNNQIQNAKDIADEIAKMVDQTPYQIVPLPIWVTDGHIRYFLEKDHVRPLAVDDPDPGKELFVLCFQEPCKPTDDPQWQIAAFHKNVPAKVATIKKLELVTIYKVIHEK